MPVMLNSSAFRVLLAGVVVAAATVSVAVHRLSGAPAQPRTGLTFERTLPEMNGKQLNVKIVDVRYAPGQVGSPHRHDCAVMVYVVSGAVRMGVRGGGDSVYKKGEVFFERPTDIHQVGANASATDSAHFTATFVCDHVGPLTVPVPPAP